MNRVAITGVLFLKFDAIFEALKSLLLHQLHVLNYSKTI
jgi:hypothetical protein